MILGSLPFPGNHPKAAKLTVEDTTPLRPTPYAAIICSKNQHIDKRIKHAALMHHERCDGSGYPYGFHSEQIDSFAKLVA
jgi:HD-GYP domain-containing protein (c-di-GMP phosphodiesterase class II)